MMYSRQKVGLFFGPLLFILFWLTDPPAALSGAAWHTAGVALWMASWWMSEAVPIPATSLLPIFLFPVLDIATVQKAAEPYANPLIYLFMGGFILALGMERCGLHKRIALNVLRRVGTKPASIIGGFMIAGALLSMWVTNTATTMMMLPIALSVVSLASEKLAEEHLSDFSPALMLAIAYSCTIGGLGTLIGTVPNALVAGFMQENYGVEIGFGEWMMVGVPIVLIGLPLTFLILTRFVFRLGKKKIEGMQALIETGLADLGRPSRDERSVAAIFGLVVFLWVARPLYGSFVPGLSDTGIAILGALLLFIVPGQRKGEEWESRFLMDWQTAKTIPWGILVLFGGGLSLASAIDKTGLAVWIGGMISGLSVLPVMAIIAAVVLLVVFLTELTSTTATTAAFLPVMASVALGIGQNPLLLVVPVTLAASAAFMLPVATPPNAIVYGSGHVSIPQMARTGIWLNLAFTLLLTAMSYFLVQWAFGVELGQLPVWAL
jgi:sodium-dependent dicarboxylate transporter 2/3/5